jgi:hypothetical protein
MISIKVDTSELTSGLTGDLTPAAYRKPLKLRRVLRRPSEVAGISRRGTSRQ